MYHAKASKNTSRSTKSLQAINKATYSGTQLLHSTVGKLATKLQVRFTRTGFRSQDAFSFGTRFSTHVPSMHVDTRCNDSVFEMLFQLCVCRGSVWRCHCRFTRLLRPAPLVEGNFADISFRGARNVSSRRCLGIRGKSRRAGVFQSGDAVESFHGFYVFFFESVRTDFAVVANHFSARSCFSTCSLVFPKPFGFYLNYSFYLNEQFIARLCA